MFVNVDYCAKYKFNKINLIINQLDDDSPVLVREIYCRWHNHVN